MVIKMKKKEKKKMNPCNLRHSQCYPMSVKTAERTIMKPIASYHFFSQYVLLKACVVIEIHKGLFELCLLHLCFSIHYPQHKALACFDLSIDF